MLKLISKNELPGKVVKEMFGVFSWYQNAQYYFITTETQEFTFFKCETDEDEGSWLSNFAEYAKPADDGVFLVDEIGFAAATELVPKIFADKAEVDEANKRCQERVQFQKKENRRRRYEQLRRDYIDTGHTEYDKLHEEFGADYIEVTAGGKRRLRRIID